MDSFTEINYNCVYIVSFQEMRAQKNRPVAKTGLLISLGLREWISTCGPASGTRTVYCGIVDFKEKYNARTMPGQCPA